MSELDRMAQYMIDGQYAARSFNIRTGDTLTVNITGLDSAGKTVARHALDAWSNVSGIQFEFVNGSAQITFTDDGGEGSTPTTVVSTSGRLITSAKINIAKETFPDGRHDFFGYGYWIYLHEIGHALGLYHPGPYSGGSADYERDSLFKYDSHHMSAMSYFRQSENTFNPYPSDAYPITPRYVDIMAIQKIYGKPAEANTGDDVYDYIEYGSGNPAAYTIYDSGGDDTLDFSGYNEHARQSIYLSPELGSSVHGHKEIIMIGPDTVIENAIGGGSLDDIIGNSADNRIEGRGNIDTLYGLEGDDELYGGRGDDKLSGGPGADLLDGGDGRDFVTYYRSESGVTVRLHNGLAKGGDAEGDTLVDIEGVMGSKHGDILAGDAGDNYLEGFDGNDVFVFQAEGGNGLDTIADFEIGVDTIRIESSSRNFGPDDVWYVNDSGDLHVVMDTNDNGQRDSNDEYIILYGISSGFSDDDIDFGRSIEPSTPEPEPEEPTPPSGNSGDITGTEEGDRLTGTSRADTIMGREGEDRLYGKGGDDILYGEEGNDVLEGGPGADVLDGGPGEDYAYYTESSSRVIVRLNDNTARYGDADGDRLLSIEHLEGSDHNDVLTGDGGDNLLSGGDGDDILYGGPAGGDDDMRGGDGDDRIYGGKGDDRMVGGEGIDIVNGGPGDDWFVIEGDDMDIVKGGSGRDTFEFSPSSLGGAIIRDFTNREDKIDLTEFSNINSTRDMDITSIGGNVRIDLSGSDYLTTIILTDFNANNLDDSDFLF